MTILSYMDRKHEVAYRILTFLCMFFKLTYGRIGLNFLNINDIWSQNTHDQQKATTKLTGLKLSMVQWVTIHLKETVAVVAGETEGAQILSPLGGWLGIS